VIPPAEGTSSCLEPIPGNIEIGSRLESFCSQDCPEDVQIIIFLILKQSFLFPVAHPLTTFNKRGGMYSDDSIDFQSVIETLIWDPSNTIRQATFDG
jgi:hypothetical protein